VDHAEAHEAVDLDGLVVVEPVRADDALEPHPQEAVVVLVPVPGGRPARDDLPAALGDVHRRAERLPAEVLEHDAGVLADEAADRLAQDPPGLGVPEPLLAELQLVAVDDVLAALRADDLRLLLGRHDGDGDAPAVLHQLRRERAEPAGRAPDQDDVALLHPGAVRPDQHPVGGAAAQRHRTRLLPGEVRGLADELVRLHDAELAERPEVRLEAPRELRLAHHAVVVGAVILLVHVRRGQHDLVADLPALHAAAGADDDARAVRPEDVVRQVVPRPVPALAAELLQERERRYRLEDRGPDGVEVDRRRHHGDDDLVGRELGHLDLADVHGAAHVLVGPALEDPDLVLAGERRAEPRRQVDLRQFGTAGAGPYGVEQLVGAVLGHGGVLRGTTVGPTGLVRAALSGPSGRGRRRAPAVPRAGPPGARREPPHRADPAG